MNSIIELKDIFKEIKVVSSKKAKEDIIKKYKDNELFTKTLKFVYDDFITTGISTKKINANIKDNEFMVLNTGFKYNYENLLDWVKEHNTGKLDTVYMLQTYINQFEDEETKQFLKDVFTKKLKVGITAKTINKVLGKGVIEEFGCQLAYPYHKYLNKLEGSEIIVTQKLDGHRSICIVKNGKATFYTRKGLVINGLDIQQHEAEKLVELGFGGKDYVLDGELLAYNADGLETKDLFRLTTSILRSDSADKSSVLFNVFDCLPYEEFTTGKSKDPFWKRKEDLANAFYSIYPLKSVKSTEIDPLAQHLRIVENIYEDTYHPNVILSLQEEYVEPLGWEGLMINLSDGLYQTKRTSDILKVKEFFNADVLVKDVFEGTGELSGTLGGVIIDYKGNDVKVGSGFTLEERNTYWANPSKIIGKVVDVQYFEETNNQNDNNISLRFPTIKSIRLDKTPEDISYEA
ncbi:ligase [Ligilactobacillus salivarius]|nr:ligase [Ligilactobacillus salivarius]